MSWKVHETDEVFAALRGLCSNSYRMYDPCEHRNFYDHDCDVYECAVEDAAREYERLLNHCDHQREQLARYEKREDGMDAIDGGAEIERTEGLSKVRAGSSITDELREYAKGRTDYRPRERLLAIADRIDAEHERGMADAELAAAPTESQMAELGWAKLPVDADGVPIHAGDTVEEVGDDPMRHTVCGIGTLQDRPAVFYGNPSKYGYADGWDFAENVRHVQPDSWERIIEDAANYDRDGWEGSFRDFVDGLVERCRRLADGKV